MAAWLAGQGSLRVLAVAMRVSIYYLAEIGRKLDGVILWMD